MIVYRSSAATESSRELCTRLRTLVRGFEAAHPTHASAVAFLIELGVFEAAVVDALSSSRDEVHPTATDLRRASVLAGHLVCATWRGIDPAASIERLAAALGAIPSASLPASISCTVPEGYAYYGLFPEQYLEAAARYASETRPDRVVCLGLRSIGTSLSAVVAAALECHGVRVVSWTLRPRGHPWSRRLDLGGMLDREWRSRLDWRFVVVDEGPGLSGSSFACTAETLSRIGVRDHAIALFPSWVPDGESFSNAVGKRWRAHSKWCASFEEVWLATGRLGADAGAESVADISAGKWRAVLFPGWATPPAVHGQHERRKFLTAPIGTNRLLLKFAGLGQFGRAALRRAEQLATAGWGPAVHRLHDGFLQLALARGRPLERRHFDAALLGALAEYLAFIRRAFPAPGTVPYERLAEMIEINVGEGLGAAALGSAMRRVRHSREAVEGAAPIGVDGRMFPHEWLETPSGYLKTDGVDHHRDHFWPGCVDIAWDVAGVITEFGLDRHGKEHFLSAYAAAARDVGLGDRLPFYRVAYLSFRLGYATLAAQTAPDYDDRERFQLLVRRYRAQLASELVGLS